MYRFTRNDLYHSKVHSSKYTKDQLVKAFDEILSHNMSGFRRGYGCESVLMKFVEDCKAALDDKVVHGAILTDYQKP